MNTQRRCRSTAAVAALLAGVAAQADSPLHKGMAVRIQSASIEKQWHSGRLHLDFQNCWMVKLDRPTREHYTMLSLLAVDQLQVASAHNAWRPIDVGAVLQSSPDACREYEAD